MNTYEIENLKFVDRETPRYTDLSARSVQEAEYVSRYGFEHNPDVCALPLPVAPKDCMEEMSEGIPGYSFEEVSKMSREDRKNGLMLLNKVRVPLPLDAFLSEEINNILCSSYFGRTNRVKEDDAGEDRLVSTKDNLSSRAEFFLIYGASGAGKTNSLRKVLSRYPEAIHHTFFDYEYIQIPVLTVTAPVGNMGALLACMGTAIDDIVGGTRWAEQTDISNVGKATRVIEAAVRLYHIGLIVIDEAQFIKFDKSSTSSVENLIGLSERTGVSLGFIANYDILSRIYKHERFMTRTMCSTYEVKIESDIDREYFRNAISHFWTYQFTKKYTDLTEEILDEIEKDCLYNIALLQVLIKLIQSEAVKKMPEGGITPEYIHDISERKLSRIRTVLLTSDPDREEEFTKELQRLNESCSEDTKMTVANAGRAYLEEEKEIKETWGDTGKYENILTSLKCCFGIEKHLSKEILKRLTKQYPDLPALDTSEIINLVKEDYENNQTDTKVILARQRKPGSEDEEKVRQSRKRTA